MARIPAWLRQMVSWLSWRTQEPVSPAEQREALEQRFPGLVGAEYERVMAETGNARQTAANINSLNPAQRIADASPVERDNAAPVTLRVLVSLQTANEGRIMRTIRIDTTWGATLAEVQEALQETLDEWTDRYNQTTVLSVTITPPTI